MEDEKHSPKAKSHETNLILLLKSSSFSAEKWLLPKNPAEKMQVLQRAVQTINQVWKQECNKFNLKTLHAYLVYITSEIAATLKWLSGAKFDLNSFNDLINELEKLLTSYKEHYKNIHEDAHIPIDRLLSALSEKLSSPYHSNPKDVKTKADFNDDTIYLSAPALLNLLQTWASCTVLSSTEIAGSKKALGQFASGKQLRGEINLNSLIAKFKANIKQAQNIDIVSWIQGLSLLDEGCDL